MFYVYSLNDPRTNQPFYIGKGSGDRCYHHLSGKVTGENPYKDRVINQIRLSGFEPLVVIIQSGLDEEAAYDAECQLIKKYGRRRYDKNGILTNLCEDKRSPSQKGKKFSETTREKMSMSSKGKPKGPMKEETKKKLSEKLKGRKNPNYKRSNDIPAWNKGLTKYTDSRVAKQSENQNSWVKGKSKEDDPRIAAKAEKMKEFWLSEKGVAIRKQIGAKNSEKLKGRKRGSEPLLKAWETRRNKKGG